MFAGWPSVVGSCWMGVREWYCLSRSVYSVSSGIQWGAVWLRVSGVVAAGGCGVGCVVAFVPALGCGWCSVVLHAVLVAMGLLFDVVQGVLGVHASEGHAQPEDLCGEAGFERPVEGWVIEALGEVDVDCGVENYPDVPRPNCCGWWCGGDSVCQGAQFAVGGRPKDGGPGVELHVETVFGAR